jgi:hypothetical protein
MKLWSAFLPEILTFAIGCPIPLAEAKLRQAAIEFFQRTRAWVEWLDPVTSVAGSVEYDLDLPTGSDVARVEKSTVDGKPIDIISYRDASYDWTRLDLTSQGIVSRDLKTFRLGQAVAAGLTIQVQVALTPSRTSTGIPDDLYDKYVDDIVHGARYRVLMTPDTTFYKPDLAGIEKALFEAAIGTNAVDAWRGQTANTPRARVKFF